MITLRITHAFYQENTQKTYRQEIYLYIQ